MLHLESKQHIPHIFFSVHAIRKPITSHDATDKKEAQAESTPTNDDTFEDAMFDPPSNHSSILDTLFESGSKDNRTIDPFRETSKMYKTEPKSLSQSGVSPDEEHDETEESSTNGNNSANMTAGTVIIQFLCLFVCFFFT